MRLRGDGLPVGSHLPTVGIVRDTVVNAYGRGDDIRDICASTGLSRTTVWRIMRWHPLEMVLGQRRRRHRREYEKALRDAANSMQRALEQFEAGR